MWQRRNCMIKLELSPRRQAIFNLRTEAMHNLKVRDLFEQLSQTYPHIFWDPDSQKITPEEVQRYNQEIKECQELQDIASNFFIIE